MSKIDTAIAIVRDNKDLPRKDLLIKLETELGVTRANASVYLFKALKSTDAPTPKKVKPVAVQPTEPVVIRQSRSFTEADQLAYVQAMAERKLSGFSEMSIDDYFDMIDNLKGLV